MPTLTKPGRKRTAENRRTYLRRKAKERSGFAGIPQVPTDILQAGNQLTDEQERTSDMIIQAATWKLLETRRERGQRTKEDRDTGYDIKEFTTHVRYGHLVARSA